MGSKIFIYDAPESSCDMDVAAAELNRLGGRRIFDAVWEVQFTGSLIAHMQPFFSSETRLVEIPYTAAEVVILPGNRALPEGLPHLPFHELLGALAGSSIDRQYSESRFVPNRKLTLVTENFDVPRRLEESSRS